MVFNHVTYPILTRLFRQLGVETRPTRMSFSVRHADSGLEYNGTSLNHLFAQRRNLLNPRFYRMLATINRFNREAVEALDDPAVQEMTLGEFVRERGYGDDFLSLYLAPMSSAVWSTPPELMSTFPAGTLIRFFHNHGFLGLNTQHPWFTVVGRFALLRREALRSVEGQDPPRRRRGSGNALRRRRPGHARDRARSKCSRR